MTINTQLIEETGVRQERINIAAFQQRLDVIVEERNEVLCQEQRVTTARTGILYGCTITEPLPRRFPESAEPKRIHPPGEQK